MPNTTLSEHFRPIHHQSFQSTVLILEYCAKTLPCAFHLTKDSTYYLVLLYVFYLFLVLFHAFLSFWYEISMSMYYVFLHFWCYMFLCFTFLICFHILLLSLVILLFDVFVIYVFFRYFIFILTFYLARFDV